MSVVHYKFKNNLEYETVSFDGLSISLGDLKRAVMAQNKTKSGEFDLEIKNAQTKEVYKDDSTQIQKNASVVIRRIPLGPKGKALTAAERPESPGSLTTKPSEGQAENEAPPVIPLSKLNKVADLATANASEDDKIAAMMNQAGEDWDPSLYARAKGRYSNVAPRVPPPAHYLCFRCRKPGHWIQSCPTNGDPNYDMKVRRTTGIPKSFLRLADNPTQKGALLIAETGQYAVPIVDHHAYEQAATKKRSKDVSGGGVEMERAIPREYLCPICKKVMTNAVVVPCCGESFCDHCIVSYLLEKEHVCPSCGKDNVSPDSIIINKLLRQAIIKFRSSNQEGSFSATSSPSALRDEDTARQGRTTPIPVSLPVSTSVVTTAPVAVTEKAPDPVVTTSAESSQAKSRESSPSIAPQVTTSPTHTPSTQSAPSGSQAQDTNSVAGASHDPVSDTRFQRVPPNDQQVSEGYAQPLRLPAHGLGSLGPIHRPSYVVASSALAHHHHAMVHATIPSLGIPAYGHLPHPALIPGPPALPFADLDPDLGLMMNEEEFYRAKMKLAERGRKKRRGEDDIKRKRKKDRSRSRRRERLVSPSSRRTLPDDDFAFELANYQAVQRDRLRRRSRSRSWTPSGSSSLSNSSWSHSWSRSKSPSRSYSRSKSRTPVNWDRSRSPTPPVEKSTKPVRLEGEDKKRKKPGRDLVRKRSKIDPKDAVSKATEKLEARLGSSDDVKSQVLSKKGKDAKTPTMKKESRKKDSDRKDSDRKDTSAKKQSTKASETVVGKTATGRGKTKEVIRKDIRNSRDGSPVVKTRANVKMKASSRGGSPVERKTAKTQEKKKKVSTSKDSSVATAVKKTTTDIKKKKETTSSNAIPARTATAGSKRKQKDTRESELVVSKDTIPRDKKRTSSKRETVRCEGSSEIKQTSVREKSSVRRDSNSEKQIKKKSRLEVNVLHSEKRDKAIERKKSGEKQKKDSVSGRTDKQASLEEDVSKAAKVKKREGKKKKQRKSVSEDIESSENREERRMSRKRPKEIKEDVGEDVEIKSPKKRKKKRDSVNEEPAKDTKHKKRKHKKKHRKHKHRKKTKHKEKKKKTTAGKEEEEKNDSEAASSLDFENELGDGIEEGDKGVVVDNEEHSGESSKSEPGLSEESEDSGEKGVESGSEYENDVEEVKNEDNESGDEGSSDGDKGMYSDGEGEDDGVDVEKEDEKMEEEQEEDDEEVEEEEVEDEQSGEEEEIEQPSEEENESDVEVEQDNEELEEEAQNSEVGEGSEVDEMEEEEKEEEVEEEKEHEDNEDEESQENEEVMEELDESEENEEEEGKDNVDESGDEQELIHGDGQGEYTGDTAGDEALLGSDADEEECSENEEDIEDLLGEDEAVDGVSETGNENPEQDLSVSDVPEENLNESVDSSKEIQDLAEADLPNDDSQNVNETELFLPTADDTLQMVPESSKQTEVTDENQIVCQNVTSEDVPEDKVNPLSEPYQEKPFSDASHEPLETVKRRPQLEFQRRNGIGETIDTRPKSIQFENFRRFDSGLGTLSSLDSTPELDDPNYTDFDAPPMFIDDRRTSNDILQALINDETGEDF